MDDTDREVVHSEFRITGSKDGTAPRWRNSSSAC